MEPYTWPAAKEDDDRMRAAKASYNRMIAAAVEYERHGRVAVTLVIEDVEDGLDALVPESAKNQPVYESQPLTIQPGVIQGTPITII